MLNNRRLTVITVHCGLNPDELENAITALVNEADKISGALIIMGDFNATPENPLLKPLEVVMHNTAKDLHNEQLTFSSDKPERTIDYIWYRNLYPVSLCTVAGIHSDHLPLVGEFEFI